MTFGRLARMEWKVPMISATGKNEGRSGGFTILEIVLVLGLIALAGAIVVTNFASMVDRGNELSTEETLQAAIRKARYLAANERKTIRLSFDAESGSLILSNNEQFPLGPEFGEDARGVIRFFLIQPSEGLSPVTDPEDARIETQEVQFSPDRSSSPFVAEIDIGSGTAIRIAFDPFSSLRRKAAE